MFFAPHAKASKQCPSILINAQTRPAIIRIIHEALGKSMPRAETECLSLFLAKKQENLPEMSSNAEIMSQVF